MELPELVRFLIGDVKGVSGRHLAMSWDRFVELEIVETGFVSGVSREGHPVGDRAVVAAIDNDGKAFVLLQDEGWLRCNGHGQTD